MKPFNPNPIAETLQYAVAGETYGVTLKVGHYGNGRPALSLESVVGRVAVATVNLPDAELPKDHLHIKTWGENEGMLQFLISNGIVEDAGVDVPTGYANARLARKGPRFPRPGKDAAA